jgi:hypothetical protein
MSKYNLIDIYEQYKIGSGWTTDFDYDGMLKAGLKTGVDTDIELLKKMVEDYTDVNYHREAHHLYNAIEALEQGAIKEASMFFGDFHAEIEETMKSQGMDIEPTVGKFMASKMEEGEEVEEVTSREGSRIEGLLDRNMKAKFLEAFQDLYFDLVEEDPFHAEDVIDHLGIEMLKHLDAIQAQGDRLAGVNTDADFEREQRAQLDMREEDAIEDEPVTEYGSTMFGPFEFLKSKGIDEEIILAFLKVHAKDIIGASEDEIMDEFEQFRSVNYDYVDENLKEHFGRFMKDYQ